ncbi:MAG: FUSC family protein [Sphingobium sp.]
MKITADQLLFAVKLFIAAMLAFALAVRLGLPQPYWALVTCCVCMNPNTGAIQSKALYRFTGTCCAGIITLAMVGLFASAPFLLIIMSGIVATLAFGISFLDRTPRAYGFQLFAITLMLVAVAGVDHPETMFDTVIGRVSEIGLGVLAATCVDAVIAPRSLGGSLRASLHRWLPRMEGWATDVLDGREADAKSEHDRLNTLTDITSFSQMTVLLRYDSTVERTDLQYALGIQHRLLRMVPLLSAIGSRLAGLDAMERAAITPCLAEARSCLEAGETAPAGLIERIRQLPLEAGPKRPWQQLVHDALADMLAELLRLWAEVQQIENALDGKAALEPALGREVSATSAFPLHGDIDHAVRMAAGISLSYVVLCALWMITGWHQGANAVLIGTVAIAFFGGGDEPGKAIAMFGRFAVLATVLAAVLCYGLLPMANDFPTFAIAMGLFIVPLGVWATINPIATLLLAFSLSNINLQGQYAPHDFGTFVEASFASLLGIFAAFLGASLFRTWGSMHQVERFLRTEAAEIVRLSRSATRRLRDAYIHRALDRIATMTARLAATGQIALSAGLLARLRVGVNIADLRMASRAMAPDARQATEDVLDRFQSEFTQADPSHHLLALIDRALDRSWSQEPGENRDRIVHALAGLRIALFERAPAWVPAP